MYSAGIVVGMVYGHLAHFAGGDEQGLIVHLIRYCSQAIERGGVCVLVTSPERRDAVVASLPPHVPVEFLDAQETLDAFYLDGRIDPRAFFNSVGAAMRGIVHRYGACPVFAYGDMVGLLWDRGERQAAADLERYWNDLGAQVPFSLFCGYPGTCSSDASDDAKEIAALHSELVA